MSESNARKEMAPTRRTADELSVVTRSQPQTVAVGRALGECLAEGDVLVLTGDLGAGKTQLTKGMAAGLGITEDVTSPTFTIEMVYEGGRLPLYHFDLYRLDDPDQLEDTGLFDVLGADGVCSIEWGEQFADEIGPQRMDVFLTRLDDDAEPGQEPAREVCLVAHDARGRELLDALERALSERIFAGEKRFSPWGGDLACGAPGHLLGVA